MAVCERKVEDLLPDRIGYAFTGPHRIAYGFLQKDMIY